MKRNVSRFLTKKERLIVRLQEVSRRFKDDSNQTFAMDLLKYYRRHGKLSKRQWHWVEKLSRRPTYSEQKAPDKKFWIYAMQAGDLLKIGYSSNPQSRRKSLQTANAKLVRIAHLIGPVVGSKDAAMFEKKLHRKCRKHFVRGEWFTMQALQIFKDFQLYDEDEFELVASAREALGA